MEGSEGIIAQQDNHKVKMVPAANLSVPTKIHKQEKEVREEEEVKGEEEEAGVTRLIVCTVNQMETTGIRSSQ